jgi:nucleotide-binding universal stress UspA family protein
MTQNAETQSAKAPVVVVGVDGSADSDVGLRWAERYAKATGARLQLVTSWESPLGYGTAYSMPDIHPAKTAHTVAEKAAAQLTLPAEQVSVNVLTGSAREVLVEASKDADLLVVGSHGHSAVGGLLLGSVSGYCTHHAAVPVVVVR